ncbi:mitochondrial lysine-tRNA synthetase [Saitoella coloradoensis]
MHHLFHRGDHISMTGIPGKTNVGELSIFTSAQSLLSPCLHPPPLTPLDLDKRMRNRHIDLMVNQSAANAIRVRSQIFTYLREFLVERGFVEVETPILSDTMGGASATPFTTQSKVTGKKELSLRIAPELWLKRLVIGGLDRVFEIGKCFRNEGIDATHNPEFTSCEYYQAYANLDDLIRCTEDLLSGMVGHLKDGDLTILNPTDPTDGEPISFAKPFRRMEFIPALEIAMGRKLPQLDDENTTESLLTLLKDLGIQPPSPPTPAKILDKLASHYLEPQCVQPTFITHIPEIMSPLAKGSEINGHRVSHRFELYVNAQEICNAYEEENDPISQRAKFTLQQSDRESGDSEIPAVDESFVHALEWGLPPTGGWGMGIDRWVMLMTGKTRIGEVLSFGGLKHVVGQGLGLRAPGEKEVQKDKESNDLQ